MAFTNDNDNITFVTHTGYDPSKPYVYQINPCADTAPFHNTNENDTTEPEYTPMLLHYHPPKFWIPQGFGPLAELLSYLAYPDSLINKIVKYTNMYALARHAKKKVKFKLVTNADILSFLALYYYMGLVKCLTRKDYLWQDPFNWPMHPAAHEIRRNRSDFIWRHMHLYIVTDVDNFEVDDGAMISEEEQQRVEVETVDNDTPEEYEDRQPTLKEVE